MITTWVNKLEQELTVFTLPFVITIISLIIPGGYEVFAGDLLLYVPWIYYSLNHNLFSANDILFSFSQTKYTFFNDIFIWLIDKFKINIIYIFYFLNLVFRFIYFLSLQNLVNKITGKRNFTIILLMVMVSISSSFYGTSSSIFNSYLHPRFIGFSLNILFLNLLFADKFILSSIILGFGSLIHIITSVPFLILFYIKLFCFQEQRKYFWFSALIPVIFLIILIIHAHSESSNLNPLMLIDPVWKNIIRQRIPWIFITDWNLNNSIFLPLVSIILFVISFNNKHNLIIKLLFVVPIFLCLVSLISVDILKISLFAQMQIFRSLLIWKLIITLVFAYFVIEKSHIYSRAKNLNLLLIISFFSLGNIGGSVFENVYCVGIYILILLFIFQIKIIYKILITLSIFIVINTGNFLFIFQNIFVYILFSLLLYFYLKNENIFLILKNKMRFLFPSIISILSIISLVILTPKIIQPSYYQTPLIQACDWIKDNTNEQDIFVIEPFSKVGSTFRVACYRSIFFSEKDGAQSVFNREYALEWEKRREIVEKIKQDINLLNVISNRYNLNYIFSDHQLAGNYPLVFNNTEHYIYKLNRAK